MKATDLRKFIKTQASIYSTAAIRMVAATMVVAHQKGEQFNTVDFRKDVSAYLSDSKAKRMAENAKKAVIVLQPVLDTLAKECKTPEDFFAAITKLFEERKWNSQNKLEQALYPDRKPNTGKKNDEPKNGEVEDVETEQEQEQEQEQVQTVNQDAPTAPTEITKSETVTVKNEPTEPAAPDVTEDRVGQAMALVAGMDLEQLKDFSQRFAAFVDAARKAA